MNIYRSTKTFGSSYKNLRNNFWTKVLYDFVMKDNVGPWSRITRPTKSGRVPVVSQQEYEQQLKSTVNSAQKSD
ncbi:unnamed protein product [Adineta steineri]|uniref:Uncharacterized protein n=1 Tax=Adineta steineri TaxID=433720 RepID=A0A814NRZ6_9BILA|nr:unnamed protein product [Adineta steineri]